MEDNSCARVSNSNSGINKLETHVGLCNGCINLCWFRFGFFNPNLILYNNIRAQSGSCQRTTTTTIVMSEAPTTTEPFSTTVTTKQENSSPTTYLPASTDPTKRDITSSTESTQTVSTTTIEALISSTFKETNDSAINLYSTTIAQTMDTNLVATASTTTPLPSPATTVNVTTKNGNAESVQGNGGVDPGVTIAVGTVCAVVFVVLIVFLLVLYRRRRQRRDKEAAGERRRSHIQPYNVSEAETDENIQDNAILESSGVRSPDVFPQDGYDVLGDVYSDRADGYLSSQDFPNRNKADTGYCEFVNDNSKSIKQDFNEGRGSGYTKGDDRTTGDYNKLNNGMVGFDLNSPGHEPETYSLASTDHFKMGPGEEKEGAGHVHNRSREDDLETYSMASTFELGMETRDEGGQTGHVHNRLRDGAGVPREDDLETYSMASTFELGMETRDEVGETGHVHNRLRDGAGVPREDDLETYSMASTEQLGMETRGGSGHVYNSLIDGTLIPGEDDIKTYNVASTEFGMGPKQGGGERGHVYNRLRDGAGMSGESVTDSDLETYNVASTKELGMVQRDDGGERGHVYNRLRDGAGVSRERAQGGDLETYNMASTELGITQREGEEESGHVYNRLRGGTGIPEDDVSETDLETYNVPAGKFEPDTENQHGKGKSSFPGKINNPYCFASTIDSDPVSSSLEVKEGGGVWVDKEDLDHKGQGQTPSGKTISGFAAIEDNRDTLEDDKQMDIRGDAEETNHGHVISPNQQSTILLEDDAEKESRRELTDPQSGDNNQDQMQTEYFVLEEEAEQGKGDVGNHNLPKDRERNLYFLAKNGQEETEYSLANDDVVKDGGGVTHQGQTMDGLVSFDLTEDTYGQEGDYFMVDGDAGIDQKAPEGDGNNNDGGREDKNGGNRIPESDNRISPVYNEIPSEEDERGYMEINEVVS